MRSLLQAKNRNFVVLQSVSPSVAIFKYFRLQISLEKATEKISGPQQLFGSDLLRTVTAVVSSLSMNLQNVFQCRH